MSSAERPAMDDLKDDAELSSYSGDVRTHPIRSKQRQTPTGKEKHHPAPPATDDLTHSCTSATDGDILSPPVPPITRSQKKKTFSPQMAKRRSILSIRLSRGNPLCPAPDEVSTSIMGPPPPPSTGETSSSHPDGFDISPLNTTRIAGHASDRSTTEDTSDQRIASPPPPPASLTSLVNDNDDTIILEINSDSEDEIIPELLTIPDLTYITVVFTSVNAADIITQLPISMIEQYITRHLLSRYSLIISNIGHIAITVSSIYDERTLLKIKDINTIPVYAVTVSRPDPNVNRNFPASSSMDRMNLDSNSQSGSSLNCPSPTSTNHIAVQTDFTDDVVHASSDVRVPSAIRNLSPPLLTTPSLSCPTNQHLQAETLITTGIGSIPTLENIPPISEQFPVIFQPLDKKQSFKPLQTGKIWQELLSKITEKCDIDSLLLLRNGGLLLRATTEATQNTLLEFTQLTNIAVKTSKPNSSVSCRGVIQDLHPDTSIDYIQDNISAPGFQILQVARLYDKNKKPTLAAITFAGSLRPKYVTFDSVRHPLRPYYEIPIQCKNCFRFAHTTSSCRSRSTCAYCGDDKHTDAICPLSLKDHFPICSNCQGQHTATSPSCPAKLVQNAILRYKTRYRTSFTTAKDHIFPKGISYAEALKRLNNTPTVSHPAFSRYQSSSVITPSAMPHIPPLNSRIFSDPGINPPLVSNRIFSGPGNEPQTDASSRIFSDSRNFPSLVSTRTFSGPGDKPQTYASITSNANHIQRPSTSSIDPATIQSLISVLTQLSIQLLPGTGQTPPLLPTPSI